MPRKAITWAEFLLAKDAILHRGEKLTVKRLIHTLGYGGSNLIARYLRKWRSLGDNVETCLPQELNFMVAELFQRMQVEALAKAKLACPETNQVEALREQLRIVESKQASAEANAMLLEKFQSDNQSVVNKLVQELNDKNRQISALENVKSELERAINTLKEQNRQLQANFFKLTQDSAEQHQAQQIEVDAVKGKHQIQLQSLQQEVKKLKHLSKVSQVNKLKF